MRLKYKEGGNYQDGGRKLGSSVDVSCKKPGS